MSEFDVLCIGNAIVDIIARAEDDFLHQNSIIKGAMNLIDEGFAVFNAAGPGIQAPNWLGIRAETCLASGQYDAGIESVSAALRKAEHYGDRWFVPRLHAIAAALCASAGRHGEAAGHADRARCLARQTGLNPMAVSPDGSVPLN